jgi:lipopolysaccharide exporter
MGWIRSRLTALMPKTKFARSVAVLSSATAVGQGVVILAAPLLTRLYTPDEYGVLGVYLSVLGIVAVVASFLYEQAIPLPGDDREAISLLALALIIVACVSLAVGGLIWIAGAELARWSNVTEIQPYLFLLPVGIFLVGVYELLSRWGVRKEAFPAIARTTLLQGGGSVAIQIGLGVFGVGALGLILGQVFGRAAGITNLARIVLSGSEHPVRRIAASDIRKVAYRYRRFPLLFTWSAWLNRVNLMGPTILLAVFFGASTAGWFALVQRIMGVPTRLLGRAVTQVYFGESARIARRNPAKLKTLFLSVLKKLSIIGCISIFPIGIVSPWVFPIVFGAEWVESGRYAAILCPMIFLQFISSPFGTTLTVLERQDLALLREVVRIILLGCAFYVARINAFSPEMTIVSLSLAGVAGYGCHIGVSWLAICQRDAQGVS